VVDSWEEGHAPEETAKSSTDVAGYVNVIVLPNAHQEVYDNHEDDNKKKHTSGSLELVIVVKSVPIDNDHGE